MATKHKYKDGWVVRYKDADGKWKNKRCGKNATAADAEVIRKMYDAEELNRRHGGVVRTVAFALGDALREFRETETPRSRIGRPKSAGTIATERTVVDNFIERFERAGVQDFKGATEDVVRGFFDDMLGMLRWAPATISRHRHILICFFDWAIRRGYCVKNPAKAIKNPKMVRKIPRYFTEEELRLIFEMAEEPYRSLFQFLYLTGLRVGEVGNLEWRDYDRGQKHIILRVMEGNKTKREEVVPLSTSAVAIVENRRAASKERHIFVSRVGTKLTPGGIHGNLQTVLKRTGIVNASPHTFRHTCASHLAIKGVSLYVIRDILRHASIKETEIYAHLSREAVATAIENLSV